MIIGEDRKLELLESARGLFEKYGYKKTTLDDIAHEVGTTKSALYYYYKNKEDIFRESIRAQLNQDIKRVKEVMDNEHDIIPAFTKALKIIMEKKKFIKGLNPSSFVDFAEAMQLLKDIAQEHFERLIKLFESSLKKATENKIIIPHNYYMTSKIIVLAMFGAKNADEIFNIEENLADHQELIVETVLKPYLIN